MMILMKTCKYTYILVFWYVLCHLQPSRSCHIHTVTLQPQWLSQQWLSQLAASNMSYYSFYTQYTVIKILEVNLHCQQVNFCMPPGECVHTVGAAIAEKEIVNRQMPDMNPSVGHFISI